MFSIYIEVCLPQYSIIWPLQSATIPQYPDHTYRQYSSQSMSPSGAVTLLSPSRFALFLSWFATENYHYKGCWVGMGHTFWDWCYYKYRPSLVRSHLEKLAVRLFSCLFVCWFISSNVCSSNRAQSSSGAHGAPGLLAHLMCIIILYRLNVLL